MTNNNIIIDIGYNCSSRDILLKFNLKTYSYPFDTKIVYDESLINCLKDDFIDFMNERYFTLFLDRECPVNKYGIALNHLFEFEENNENDNDYFSIDEIEKKLNLNFYNKTENYKYNVHNHSKPRILCKNYLDILP